MNTPEPFLEKLAEPRPDPGGGAAAAYGAMVAMALLEKVARIELARPASEEDRSWWSGKLKDIRGVAETLPQLLTRDVKAYKNFLKARDVGQDALNAALTEMLECPLDLIQAIKKAFLAVGEVGTKCKTHLVSDLQVSCELLGGAMVGIYYIARANLNLLPDKSKETRKRRLFDKFSRGMELFLGIRNLLADRTPHI